MKIISVVGARPNFMKIAPLHRAFSKINSIESKIVHTGQHYDERMSEIFFTQLELPKPDYYLGVGSGSHAEVTAKVMIAFEKIIIAENPDMVVVVGDVNSTLACAIVTKKLNIPLTHVEAGLRSGDRTMPEEINRIMTDSIADFLFVTEESGLKFLKQEGIPDARIFFVGNVMIDSLVFYSEKASALDLLQPLGMKKEEYVLMTIHRPSNVDHLTKLETILEIIQNTAEKLKVLFPIHPRTIKRLKSFNLWEKLNAIKGLEILEPQGYLQFLNLMQNAKMIITDSGGIQEESTYLRVPCITLRDNTERPITIDLGTNQLIPDLNISQIDYAVNKILSKDEVQSTIPPLWDGKAADRISNQLVQILVND